MKRKPSAVMISLKALFGIMIAFSIAIPRIASANFILGDVNSYLIYTMIFIAFIVIYVMLFNSLKINHGSIINFIKFIGVSIFEGLMLSQGVLVAAYWVNYFTEGGVSPELIVQVCSMAVVATFVAVLGGLVITPIILRREGTIKIADNIGKVILTVMIAYGLLYLFAFLGSVVTGIFGAGNFFSDFFVSVASIFYGTGPLSMFLSFMAVLGAEILFIFTIIGVKQVLRNSDDKFVEWQCAAMIEVAVLKIFIEIFRLLLKANANE